MARRPQSSQHVTNFMLTTAAQNLRAIRRAARTQTDSTSNNTASMENNIVWTLGVGRKADVARMS
jgi:hypothetical protein